MMTRFNSQITISEMCSIRIKYFGAFFLYCIVNRNTLVLVFQFYSEWIIIILKSKKKGSCIK